MDIILGGFAEKFLSQLTTDELILYERLLLEPDDILYNAIIKIICNQAPIDNHLKYSKDLLLKIALSHEHQYSHQLL